MKSLLPRLMPLLAVSSMVVFGFAVYVGLGFTRSDVTAHKKPAPLAGAKPVFTLPGTLFVAQGGGLYASKGGAFRPIARPGGWTQPALSPDGAHLVAVKRSGNLSDLYQLGLDGSVQKQLTSNEAAIVEVNHWAFYPRYSPDGSELFYSSDRPKAYDYRVDMAVWSMPAAGGEERQWTDPNYYTGGDVQPAPLSGSALLYTKYDINSAGESVSTIELAEAPHDRGAPLTAPAEKCSEPALSPDGGQLAMICVPSPRIAQLIVAPFDGHQLGARRVLRDGTLAAAPSWAPDGSGLAYFAPEAADPGGSFQLWWSPLAGATRQLTTTADLDALSPVAWAR